MLEVVGMNIADIGIPGLYTFAKMSILSWNQPLTVFSWATTNLLFFMSNVFAVLKLVSWTNFKFITSVRTMKRFWPSSWFFSRRFTKNRCFPIDYVLLAEHIHLIDKSAKVEWKIWEGNEEIWRRVRSLEPDRYYSTVQTACSNQRVLGEKFIKQYLYFVKNT